MLKYHYIPTEHYYHQELAVGMLHPNIMGNKIQYNLNHLFVNQQNKIYPLLTEIWDTHATSGMLDGINNPLHYMYSGKYPGLFL